MMQFGIDGEDGDYGGYNAPAPAPAPVATPTPAVIASQSYAPSSAADYMDILSNWGTDSVNGGFRPGTETDMGNNPMWSGAFTQQHQFDPNGDLYWENAGGASSEANSGNPGDNYVIKDKTATDDLFGLLINLGVGAVTGGFGGGIGGSLGLTGMPATIANAAGQQLLTTGTIDPASLVKNVGTQYLGNLGGEALGKIAPNTGLTQRQLAAIVNAGLSGGSPGSLVGLASAFGPALQQGTGKLEPGQVDAMYDQESLDNLMNGPENTFAPEPTIPDATTDQEISDWMDAFPQDQADFNGPVDPAEQQVEITKPVDTEDYSRPDYQIPEPPAIDWTTPTDNFTGPTPEEIAAITPTIPSTPNTPVKIPSPAPAPAAQKSGGSLLDLLPLLGMMGSSGTPAPTDFIANTGKQFDVSSLSRPDGGDTSMNSLLNILGKRG